MSTVIERPQQPWGNVIPLGYKFYPGPLFRRRFVSELWSRAKAIPTLDLRFADSKSLTDAVSGQNLITFTRASSGTYVGSDGLIKTALANAPRFDHNPVTGESLGLLIEEQRTNLLLRSEEFDKSWTTGGLTVSPSFTASPDGANTADKLIESASLGTRSLFQVQAASATKTYTASVYVKANGRHLLGVWLRGASSANRAVAQFNLSTGTVSLAAQNLGNFTAGMASISAKGNGWYRCSITATTGAGETACGPTWFINLTPGVQPNESYTGDGTSGLYLWGAQLEAGAFPTSYIPTTNAQVTRNADVASITGSNFSSWYRQDEGTVFADAINSALSTVIFAVSDGSTGNRIQADVGTNSRVARVVTGGVTQASNSVPYAYGAQQSFAVSYLLNSINFANAGTLGTEDTSATIPTVDQLRIGANPTGTSALNSTISRLTFFNRRLPNATLQAITKP